MRLSTQTHGPYSLRPARTLLAHPNNSRFQSTCTAMCDNPHSCAPPGDKPVAPRSITNYEWSPVPHTLPLTRQRIISEIQRVRPARALRVRASACRASSCMCRALVVSTNHLPWGRPSSSCFRPGPGLVCRPCVRMLPCLATHGHCSFPIKPPKAAG